ncbi:MAG: hypothetical protein CMO98_01150 [Woeseia sp.]|nr:hypothetical protein [Woeseia sp.]|tara:strand:+ start:1798 stop:2541 length:744 start_codon:yes stop_codon:yes gene_type:complete
MANEALLSTVIKEEIGELALNNPARKNALSKTLLNDLNNALKSMAAERVRVVILTGSNKTFSAGADFEDLTGTIADKAIDKAIEEVVLQIRNLPIPVIAAVEGPCLGGAVDITLACDLNVASEQAFFEVPATRLGLLYNPEAVQRWHTRLSSSTLRRILLLGEKLTATEASYLGIVSHVVPEGSALETAHQFANRIKDASQTAVASTKHLLGALEKEETDLAKWTQVYEQSLDSPERRDLVSRLKNS